MAPETHSESTDPGTESGTFHRPTDLQGMSEWMAALEAVANNNELEFDDVATFLFTVDLLWIEGRKWVAQQEADAV